jgi:hypothetical protein
VNAAFLLVTSACLVGQTGAKPVTPAPVPPPAAPIVASACGSGCSSGCDTCGCEGFGTKLRDRLRGLFNRDCDTCQPTTCHTPIRSTSCDDCRPKVWKWEPKCHAPVSSCGSCDSCEKESILSRLRGLFHRNDCGCDGGCGATGCAGNACAPSPVTTIPPAEKVAPPKKMPAAPIKDAAPPKQEVRIENQPSPVPQVVAPPAIIPSVPAAPTIEVSPVPAPRIEGVRDPF